ncbi:MAG TPA: zinc ribbon domain-containing protein [Tepidiformaceae bacterium]|nr:zinc ribbon domain-containing protein [Tepidiformaceae bacterium]
MPIYEFRCSDCGKVTNHFTRKVDTEVRPPCEHCGSAKTARMMSKFGRSYTRADIIEKYGDPSEGRGGPDDYRDPRQIGSGGGERVGEDGMDPPEGAREMIGAAREGEFPDPVKDL